MIYLHQGMKAYKMRHILWLMLVSILLAGCIASASLHTGSHYRPNGSHSCARYANPPADRHF